jgi:hypothetical protein
MQIKNKVAWEIYGTFICAVDRRETTEIDTFPFDTVVEVDADGTLQTLRGANRVTVTVAGERDIGGVQYTRVVVREVAA